MSKSTARDPALRAVVDAYVNAWNAHDASALGVFFAEDADLVMGNSPPLRGRRSIEGYWRTYFANQEPERRITIEIDSLRLIGVDTALLDVATATGGSDAQGTKLPVRRARGTWVMVRQDDTWAIAALRGLPSEQDRVVRHIES